MRWVGRCGVGLIISLACVAYAPQLVAQALGKDGFPVDYRPEDFAVSDENAIEPAAGGQVAAPVARAVSASAPKPVGTSFRIDQLPRTSSTVPGLKATTASTTEKVPVLPQPAQPAPLADGDPWTGASLPMVTALMDGLQPGAIRTDTGTMALQDTLRQVLLTTGVPPRESGDGKQTGALDDTAWVRMRAEALLKLQDDEAAWSLLQGLGKQASALDERTAWLWAEQAMVAGEREAACAQVPNWVRKSGANQRATWQQALVTCQLLANETEGARLSWQLASENTTAMPNGFAAVVNRWLAPQVNGNVAKVEPTKADSMAQQQVGALTAALLVGRPDILDALMNSKNMTELRMQALPLVALRRLVNTGGLPLKLRLAAAEQLAGRTRQAADVQAVALLYQALTFNDEAKRDPVGYQGKTEPAAERALLWQVATDAQAPASLRTASLMHWYQQAKAAGLQGLADTVTMAQVGIKPELATVDLTPVVLAQAWAQGETTVALAWLEAMSKEKVPEAYGRRIAVWRAVSRLLHGEALDAGMWQTLIKDVKNQDDIGALLAWARLQGMPVPESVLVAVVQRKAAAPVAAPDEIWRQMLLETAEKGQLGVALLTAVQGQVGENPAANGWWLARAEVLKKLGKTEDMRRMAGMVLAGRILQVTETAVKLPTVNGGLAPTSKGREIGGKPKVFAKETPALGTAEDPILLPPRVR